MIAEAIQCVRDELNQAMKRRFSSTDDVVVVSNLFEPDGSPSPYAADKLAMFLVNVEREAAGQSRALSRVGGIGGNTGLYQPPVFLNLMVMFAATFSGARYAESLKLVSAATAFFQGRPVFDQQNTPNLDRGIEKLSFELENLTIADLGNLWGVLGGRYVPSVLMRARMVVIDSAQITLQIPAVTRPETGARPAGVV